MWLLLVTTVASAVLIEAGYLYNTPNVPLNLPNNQPPNIHPDHNYQHHVNIGQGPQDEDKSISYSISYKDYVYLKKENIESNHQQYNNLQIPVNVHSGNNREFLGSQNIQPKVVAYSNIGYNGYSQALRAPVNYNNNFGQYSISPAPITQGQQNYDVRPINNVPSNIGYTQTVPQHNLNAGYEQTNHLSNNVGYSNGYEQISPASVNHNAGYAQTLTAPGTSSYNSGSSEISVPTATSANLDSVYVHNFIPTGGNDLNGYNGYTSTSQSSTTLNNAHSQPALNNGYSQPVQDNVPLNNGYSQPTSVSLPQNNGYSQSVHASVPINTGYSNSAQATSSLNNGYSQTLQSPANFNDGYNQIATSPVIVNQNAGYSQSFAPSPSFDSSNGYVQTASSSASANLNNGYAQTSAPAATNNLNTGYEHTSASTGTDILNSDYKQVSSASVYNAFTPNVITTASTSSGSAYSQLSNGPTHIDLNSAISKSSVSSVTAPDNSFTQTLTSASGNLNSGLAQTTSNAAVNINSANIPNNPPVAPIIHKHIYFHVPPPEIEEEPKVLPPPPPPKKNYKILFIKVPSQESKANLVRLQQEIAARQKAASEDKTLIYVLVKNPEDPKPIVLPKPKPSEHQVYFVKYNGNPLDIASQVNDELDKTGSVKSIVPLEEGLVNGQHK